MSLQERLQKAPGAVPPGPSSRRDPALNDVRLKVHQSLIEELGPVIFDNRLSADELKARVHKEVHRALGAVDVPLSAADKTQLLQDVTDDVLGYGPIDRFLRDPAVTEVMVNGPDQVFVEKAGKLTLTGVTFVDDVHVRRIIEKIVAQVGRRIDEASPLCDARLPDGSRVNAVIHPLAIGGPFLTIRKFAAEPYTVKDLIDFGTLTEHTARFLEACVQGRLNIVVAGGTGTGKTTTLNVLSSFIPEDERIITIEDAKELQLRQVHVLSMEARPANIEGRGEIRIRDLVKNALRMRPNRIVVGECRSGEALDMLQAMNTGHDGSITTVHANSPRDTLSRLETLVLMAGLDLPIRAIREQMASALDLIVQLTRFRDGTRRVTQVTEIQRMEGDVIVLQDLFTFDFGMGLDEMGRHRGSLKSTGMWPQFSQRLEDQGIKLPPDTFASEGIGRPAPHVYNGTERRRQDRRR
jgi:pilus assembly protein CpaF